MNRYFITIILLVLLTGCSSGQYSLDEASAPEAMDNFNKADIIGRMTAIKNGLKPNVKPSGAPASELAQPATGGQAQPPAPNQPAPGVPENLAAQFDSAVIKTSLGDITVKFYGQESPATVNNFLSLAKAGFYNGTSFHRVIKDFMIQGGDPNSKDDDWSNDGQGGPGYKFKDEFSEHKLVKGSLAMANSGPNTNGSQFFIVTKEATPWLDGKHTNFGYVVKGMEIVEKIEKVEVNGNDHPLQDVVLIGIEPVRTGAGDEAKAVGPELPPDAAPEDEPASSTAPVSGD